MPIRVEYPGGTVLGAGDVHSPVMCIHRPRQFYSRIGVDAKIGFGQSYMAGDWSTPDLVGVLTSSAVP